MSATTPHGQFVAAARYLRANGYDVNGKNDETRLDISYGENVYGQWWLEVQRLTEFRLRDGRLLLDAYPTSMTQAIDLLVVAKVLPAEFGSWNRPQQTLRVAEGRDIGWIEERAAVLYRGPSCNSRLALHHGGYLCSLRNGHTGTHLASINSRTGLVTAEWTDDHAEVAQ